MLIYLDPVRPNMFLNKESLLGQVYYFDKFEREHTITSDIDEYLASTDPTKIAVFYNRFYMNDPADKIFFDRYFHRAEAISKMVFIAQTELHGEDINPYIKDHVYAILPGVTNTFATVPETKINIANFSIQQLDDFFGSIRQGLVDKINCYKNIIIKSPWIESVTDMYKQLPDIVDSINYRDPRPLYFDVLLGSYKQHRDFVYHWINENNLSKKCLVNYGVSKEGFIYEPGTVIDQDDLDSGFDHSVLSVRYHGIKCHLSSIIPVTIYNQTAYSLIAETRAENTISFFTEKVIKPIIARRLFVVISGYRYLENLRILGFKTFDGVIDESYDLIEDSHERWTQAMQQVEYLCSQDQQSVLTQIHDIVEHNYQLIMESNWENTAISLIHTKINQIC